MIRRCNRRRNDIAKEMLGTKKGTAGSDDAIGCA